MAASIRQFYIELYEEYLEEASFLYEQRLSLFDDPEITWLDIGEFEERFEAHIDGLVVGEDLALDVCKRRAMEGDFGELHAAMRVFCRQNQPKTALEMLADLDLDDEERVRAVADAFKHELPDEWIEGCTGIINDGYLQFATLFSTVFGYRRLQKLDLYKFLKKIPNESLPTVIWALGRLGDQNARDFLLDYLEHEDENVRGATALALLRLGEPQALFQSLQNIQNHSWALIPLGLGGDSLVVTQLLELVKQKEFHKDALIALGMLGDISAVPDLLTCLDHPERTESATLGLQLITGANLYEDVFIPEEIDEQELFEEELKKYKETGEVPKNADGKPFGETIKRLSQNSEDWQPWWSANSNGFKNGIRYRNGKPYSIATLIDNLVDEQTPHLIRTLANEELVIRYGMPIPFETDMTARQQQQRLNEIAQWANTNNNRFKDGEWYFAQRPCIDTNN